MDTKLKSISYSNSIKTLVFILTLVAGLSAVGCITYIAYNQDYVTSDRFENTYSFRNNYESSIKDIVDFELDLVSEEFINNTYKEKQLRISKLRDYKTAKSRIDNKVNFLYYIKNLEDDSVNTNVSNSFAYLEDQLSNVYYLNSELNSIDNGYSSHVYYLLRRLDEFSYEFRSAVKKDLLPGDIFYSEYQKFNEVRKYSAYIIAGGIIASIISFAGFIYLIVTTGRVSKSSDLKLSFIDKVPFEIQFMFFIIIASLEAGLLSNLYNTNDIYTLASFIIPTLAIFALVTLIFLLSIARRVKDHSFFKNFLVYKLCRKCISFIVNPIKKIRNLLLGFRRKSIFKSWFLGFMIGYLIANVILIVVIITTWEFTAIIASIVLVLFNAKVFYEVYKFLESLQEIILASDSASYASDVKTLDLESISPSLHELGSNIINIQSGIRTAVDKALKGEQMKTALITNVSHDLKTPLTSIITYVDLLKKEKFVSDNASNYLQVIDEKSYRLKTLIEDIIEVNKASTGNMTVNKTKVNFNELINQTMGEYEYKISDSNLEFKLNIAEEATFIEADSKSMWRILENLMENALKYSAENSRIYIDIDKSSESGFLTIKNMSKLPLDISPDQLTERFVRGDVARSSEGSGLGLSIAQSLADIQGGNFEVIIDGDLFKVLVTMPLWNK